MILKSRRILLAIAVVFAVLAGFAAGFVHHVNTNPYWNKRVDPQSVARREILEEHIIKLLGDVKAIFGFGELTTHKVTSRSQRPAAFFQGIREVVLYVRWSEPDWAAEALRCHGMEEQCGDEFISRIPEYMKPTTESRDEYVSRLKEDFRDYPSPLRPDALKQALAGAIRKEFTNHHTVLVEDTPTGIHGYITKRGTAIVIIDLYIQKDTSPHIAILNASLYRPYLQPAESFASLSLRKTVAIPLNLSEAEIGQRVRSATTGWYLYWIDRYH
jgi:hypothetical protein